MHIRSLPPHFCYMLVGFSLQSPVGPLLPEEQVLLRQLQGELGHLQPGLVQLSVGVSLSGSHVPQLPAEALGHVLSGLQTLLQPSHLRQSNIALHLRRNERFRQKREREINFTAVSVSPLPAGTSSSPRRASFDWTFSSLCLSACSTKRNLKLRFECLDAAGQINHSVTCLSNSMFLSFSLSVRALISPSRSLICCSLSTLSAESLPSSEDRFSSLYLTS